MPEYTLLHNPRCSKSRAAKQAVDEAGADVRVIEYLNHPLDAAELRDLLGKLTDEPGKLVRRDAKFKELGLGDADVQTAEQVVAVLAEHPQLMERPVLIHGDTAVIGRPTERITGLLGG